VWKLQGEKNGRNYGFLWSAGWQPALQTHITSTHYNKKIVPGAGFEETKALNGTLSTHIFI
jgi:hypothetical protein